MRPVCETVDGVECIVIDVRQEHPVVLWCDPALGYALRKSEWQFVRGKRRLPSRTTFSDFANVCRGLWLPRKTVTEIFDDRRAAAANNAPLLRWDDDVVEIHANDVEDELFTLTIPEGMLVQDFVHGEKLADGTIVARPYYEPVSDPQADQALDVLGRPGAPPQGRIPWYRSYTLSGGGFVLLGTIGILWARRRWKTQRSASIGFRTDSAG